MIGRSFVALAAVALVLLLLVASEDASAVTYKVNHTTSLSCNGRDVGDPDDNSCAPGTERNPGEHADITTVLIVDSVLDGKPGRQHSNFAKVFSFTAPATWNIEKGSTIDDGALSAVLYSTTTLSILNGPCTTTVPVAVSLFDATTDMNAEAYWLGDGENLLEDSNSNGMPEYIDKYPTYLKDAVDLGVSGPSPKPRARYAGHVHATAGAPATQVELLVFDPGELAQFKPPNVEADFLDSLGYPTYVVMDNPMPLAAVPSEISEFCAPLSTSTTSYGKTQGKGVLYMGPLGIEFDVPAASRCAANPSAPLCLITRSTNAAAGTGIYGGDTHLTSAYSQSYRDADDDGIPNNEDGCPVHGINDGCAQVNSVAETGDECNNNISDDWPDDDVVNDGCPTIGSSAETSGAQCLNAIDDDPADDGSTTDTDSDGVEDVCDPAPGTAATDIDGDGFQNRQDNCPLHANSDQADSDVMPASDGGPGDSIGDACDPNLADATSEGYFLKDYPISAVCLGTDTDGDGWCDGAEGTLGSCATDSPSCEDQGYGTGMLAVNSTPESAVLDVEIDPVPGTCSDRAWYATAGDPTGAGAEIDNDGDTLANAADPGSTPPANDTDEDGVVNASDNCPSVWNPDQLNTDGDVQGDACDADDDGDGISDRLEYLYGGQPKNAARYDWATFGLDIDGNTLVQIGDVLAFKGNTANKPVPQAGTVP
jgi:hypothetical protein